MEDKSSKGIGVKAIFAIVLLALFTIFALQNTEVVEITFLFWKFNISRVLILLISLAIGGLVGVVIGWVFLGKKKQQP